MRGLRVAEASGCTLDDWRKFTGGRGREGEVCLGASVGLVPSGLPCRDGELFGLCLLKSDRVRLSVVRGKGSRGCFAGEVDASADTSDRDHGWAPFDGDPGVPETGEDLGPRRAELARERLSRVGT